jgi:hypothetical protein
MVETGKMRLGQVKFLVLDEADWLLDTGNKDTIQKVPPRPRPRPAAWRPHTRAPRAQRHPMVSRNPGGRLKTMLFSATLHDPTVKILSSTIQCFPTWVDLKGEDSVPDTGALAPNSGLSVRTVDTPHLSTVPAICTRPRVHRFQLVREDTIRAVPCWPHCPRGCQQSSDLTSLGIFSTMCEKRFRNGRGDNAVGMGTTYHHRSIVDRHRSQHPDRGHKAVQRRLYAQQLH